MQFYEVTSLNYMIPMKNTPNSIWLCRWIATTTTQLKLGAMLHPWDTYSQLVKAKA